MALALPLLTQELLKFPEMLALFQLTRQGFKHSLNIQRTFENRSRTSSACTAVPRGQITIVSPLKDTLCVDLGDIILMFIRFYVSNTLFEMNICIFCLEVTFFVDLVKLETLIRAQSFRYQPMQVGAERVYVPANFLQNDAMRIRDALNHFNSER